MQTAAYVCLSRVKELLKICVLQPFSPLLFTRGPPGGPHRLMRKLAKHITTQQASNEWWKEQSNEQNDAANSSENPMSVDHMCTACYLKGRSTYMLPVKEFGVTTPQEFFGKYISQGCWTRCLQCQKEHGLKVTCSDLMATLPTARHETEQTHGLCTICNEKNIEWTTPLVYDSHGCSRCKKIIPSVEWSQDDLKNHANKRVEHLVCKQCRKLGYSAKDLTGYDCNACRKQFGHLQFDADVLYNAKRRNRTNNLCKDRVKSLTTLNSVGLSKLNKIYRQDGSHTKTPGRE